MIKPVAVTDLEKTFGRIEGLLPELDDIPEEFKTRENIWNKFTNSLFLGSLENLELYPKENIDPQIAYDHIHCILKSFEPKHEHKIAGCAYLFSEFFLDFKYKNKNGKLEDWHIVNFEE